MRTLSFCDDNSLKDTLQIAEPGYGIFSKSFRCFNDVMVPLPSNLWQIAIKGGGISPIHGELFHWGEMEPIYRPVGNKTLYRPDFPLHPYPILIFMPVLVDFMQKQLQDYQELANDKNFSVNIERIKPKTENFDAVRDFNINDFCIEVES